MIFREHDRNILAAYHQELQACGVSADAYGEGQLYRDFRLGLMTASQHPAFAAVNLYVRDGLVLQPSDLCSRWCNDSAKLLPCGID